MSVYHDLLRWNGEAIWNNGSIVCSQCHLNPARYAVGNNKNLCERCDRQNAEW